MGSRLWPEMNSGRFPKSDMNNRKIRNQKRNRSAKRFDLRQAFIESCAASCNGKAFIRIW